MFCPKCGGILMPKGGKLVCASCGPVQAGSKIRDMNKVEKKEIAMIREDIPVHAKTRAECAKCGCNEAYYWFVQTRAADEAPTRFYKCVKCGNTWREYS
jgi:DNA-directed RNA polymerase subunit M